MCENRDVTAELMTATVRVARAIRSAFRLDGLSLWQSGSTPTTSTPPENAIRASMAKEIGAHLD